MDPLERPGRARDNLEPEGAMGHKKVRVFALKTLWAWIIRAKLNNHTRTQVLEHLVGVHALVCKHSEERVAMEPSG